MTDLQEKIREKQRYKRKEQLLAIGMISPFLIIFLHLT